MRIGLLDAWDPADPALVNSHWVAEQHRARLLGHEVELLSGGDLVPAQVAAVIEAGGHDGWAFFGHGAGRSLVAHGQPVVDHHLGPALNGRWLHAFACRSDGVCESLAATGAAAVLGYTENVTLEWELVDLPPTLLALFGELVVAGTGGLVAGERSRSALRRQVREAAETVTSWLIDHEELVERLPLEQQMGLWATPGVLHQALFLVGATVVE